MSEINVNISEDRNASLEKLIKYYIEKDGVSRHEAIKTVRRVLLLSYVSTCNEKDRALKAIDEEILPTDRALSDSPDACPEFLCSRCGKAIDVNEMPIRVWAPCVKKPNGTVEKLGHSNYKDKVSEIGTYTFVQSEYRYHPTCLGVMIVEDECSRR